MQDRIYGQTNPVLEIILNPDESVRSWAGDCAWMTETIDMIQEGSGHDRTWLGKMFSGDGAVPGQQLVTFRATKTPGMVAFAPRLPGEILSVDVRDHDSMNYLCAADALLCVEEGVDIEPDQELKTLGTSLYTGGFSLVFLDGIGRAWVGIGGTNVAYDLRPDETIRVHPGHFALAQNTVSVGIMHVAAVRTPTFPDGVRLLEISGPGRVWLNSLGVGPLAEGLDDFSAPVELPGSKQPKKDRGVLREVLFPRPEKKP